MTNRAFYALLLVMLIMYLFGLSAAHPHGVWFYALSPFLGALVYGITKRFIHRAP